MRIRNGIVTTLHAYSADSEFTNVLKGRYITNVINNNVIVLDNDMHLHIQIDNSRTFIQYINVWGKPDARIRSAYLEPDDETTVNLTSSSLETLQTYTLSVDINGVEYPVFKIVQNDELYTPDIFTITAYANQDVYVEAYVDRYLRGAQFPYPS